MKILFINKLKKPIAAELTERKSQPGDFPYAEAFRILSFFTSQSSPDKASVALGIPPFACWKTY